MKTQIIKHHILNSDNTTTEPAKDDTPKLGEWYWITFTCRWDNEKEGLKEGDKYEDFRCVMKVGSNYVELHSPHSKNGYSTSRVHMEDFYTRLRFEPDPDTVIQQYIKRHQQESDRLIEEVKSLTARLGLKPVLAIDGYTPNEPTVDTSTTALVTMSEHVDVKAYKTALIEAKERLLPDLFKAIKGENEELCRWMLATTMGTKALMIPMEKTIDEINNRIFNVSLYAGLTEEVIQCSDGEPAELLDKLHVMQRMAYMDEECLVNYEAGGMEFKDIKAFDEWIVKPENKNRILPFPRTLVAMRVRRNIKDRESGGDLLQAYINMNIAQSDKFTFLYIRNGEQVWRMSCKMEFSKMLFPDKSMFDPSEAKMVKMFCNKVDSMISVHDYEERVARYNETEREIKLWDEKNTDDSLHNPHRHSSFFNPSEWRPFDPSNVYFDECMAETENKIKEYNRIAIIIQGIFDRSQLLHPHLPVKTWTPDGFEKALKLVYDGVTTLYHGEPPDFEDYRAKCNASLKTGSIVTGQELYWLKQEAVKENKRLDEDWRCKDGSRHKTFKPYGNPGPRRVASIQVWKPRTHMAVFTWYRERLRYNEYNDFEIKTTLAVPQSQLFNISAYKPGDYKQFFNDPRTREKYLKWVSLLLTAEDYKAGKIHVRDINIVNPPTVENTDNDFADLIDAINDFKKDTKGN